MSKVVEGAAVRRGRFWVVRLPEFGVYGQGRGLLAARVNTEQGLAAIGVTATVTLIPTTPELEELRAAKELYEAALVAAVTALSLRRTGRRDIAEATEVSASRVKAILAAQSALPASAGDVPNGAAVEEEDGSAVDPAGAVEESS